MSASRLATIPFEHVEAELAVFPLASETSFRLGTASLNPLVSQDNVLWRAAEQEVMTAFPSLPLDEALAIRDKVWFGASGSDQDELTQSRRLQEEVPLTSYLRRLTTDYIDSQGRPVEVRRSSDYDRERAGAEGRLRWSWLCQAFPPDLLRVARRVVAPDANPLPLSPIIGTMLLDKGFAETHLHLGAALDFSLAWSALMRTLATSESQPSDFESPGAYFDGGNDFCTWVMHAAVGRLVLAESLSSSRPNESSLNELLSNICHRPWVRLDVIGLNRLAATLADLRSGRWFEYKHPNHRTKPREQLAKRFARTRAIYQQLIRPSNLRSSDRIARRALRALHKPQSRADIFGNDPLAQIVGWQSAEGISPETLFIEASLQRIEEDEERGHKETDFARLFWQVMRVRCLLYRHVVQRPLTPGLQWFVRFFSRIKPLRKNIPDSVLAMTAARVTGEDAGLRSLEVRLGTDKSETKCLELVRDLEKSALSLQTGPEFRFFRIDRHKDAEGAKNERASKFEIGGVFHFSRKRGGGWETGKSNAYGLDHSYPALVRLKESRRLEDAGNPTGFRFARFYLEQRRHAQALVSVLNKYPDALRTVRGVDLCTDEAGVPLWVMVPLVRWVREAGERAANHLKRRSESKIPPLRTTVHAGEDFVHLLAGLRRIDNTVTYLHLEEGDRLGHGLALGIDALTWCASAGRVVQTREERLLDLVWELSCYARNNVDVTSTRMAFVRYEIIRLARCIFRSDSTLSCTAEDLMDFVDHLHTNQALANAGFPDKPSLSQNSLTGGAAQWRLLLNAYLRDKDVWRNGRVLETIGLRNLKHEIDALSALQTALQQRIGELCLTIEINPSSNLLIGDLIDLQEHPLWRIRPIGAAQHRSPLAVCIGTDNPITFATNLPHEYQLLFDAMVLGNESNEVARNWLNEVRETGMMSRFTLAPDVAGLSRELKVPNLLEFQRPMSPP